MTLNPFSKTHFFHFLTLFFLEDARDPMLRESLLRRATKEFSNTIIYIYNVVNLPDAATLHNTQHSEYDTASGN